MEYIHIKSLERYHPGYTDRQLRYAKIYINMASGDPDCELIEDEIDWARFVKMILLELRAQKPLPNIDRFWAKNGFNLKKRPMSLTLKMLHTFIETVTMFPKERVLEESRVEESRIDKSTVTEVPLNTFLEKWNNSGLPCIRGITGQRKKHIAARLAEPEFVNNYDLIISKIKESDFLTGRTPSATHPNFKATFDWVIINDTNYVKILEGKYDNRKSRGDA